MGNGKKAGEFSAPAKTYIQEKIWERKLGRSINVEKQTNAMLWGHLLEPMVNDLLPSEYRLTSKKRFAHSEIENWNGMPDLITKDTVADIKCPEPKAFMQLLDIFEAENKSTDIKGNIFKEENPEYFWQLVSNGILTGRNIAELVVFMPKENRLTEILGLCENEEDFKMQEKFKRIFYAPVESLALMPDDCELNELNIFTFEIQEADKLLLAAKVQQANTYLK